MNGMKKHDIDLPINDYDCVRQESKIRFKKSHSVSTTLFGTGPYYNYYPQSFIELRLAVNIPKIFTDDVTVTISVRFREAFYYKKVLRKITQSVNYIQINATFLPTHPLVTDRFLPPMFLATAAQALLGLYGNISRVTISRQKQYIDHLKVGNGIIQHNLFHIDDVLKLVSTFLFSSLENI